MIDFANDVEREGGAFPSGFSLLKEDLEKELARDGFIFW